MFAREATIVARLAAEPSEAVEAQITTGRQAAMPVSEAEMMETREVTQEAEVMTVTITNLQAIFEAEIAMIVHRLQLCRPDLRLRLQEAREVQLLQHQ